MTAKATSGSEAPSLAGRLLSTQMAALRSARVAVMFKLYGPPHDGESPNEYVARVLAANQGGEEIEEPSPPERHARENGAAEEALSAEFALPPSPTLRSALASLREGA